MSKAMPIRTDDALYEKLDALARATDRSKNYLANEALKAFLEKGGPTADVPVVKDSEDLAGDFWPEDDREAFLAYLSEERAQSLEDDRVRELLQSNS